MADTTPTVKTVRVEYFAALREQRGADREQIQTSADTPRALYEELRTRHGFSLPHSVLTVAVNEEMSDWDVSLQPGDTVVFLPPVAGG